MKTLSAFVIVAGITAATVIGLQQNSMLTPAMDKVESVAADNGLIQKSPANIITGLDITAGREEELVKDKKAIEKQISNLNVGDRFALYLIHSRAESAQEEIFSIIMPENAGPMGQSLKRAKDEALKKWNTCWQEMVMPLVHSDNARLKEKTDLLGFLRFVANQKQETLKDKNVLIVLYTDGQHVGDGFNMEKRVPEIDNLEKDSDCIPDLKGVRLAFIGMTPTHNISNDHWRQLQKFWKAYGNAAGAKHTFVSSERSSNI